MCYNECICIIIRTKIAFSRSFRWLPPSVRLRSTVQCCAVLRWGCFFYFHLLLYHINRPMSTPFLHFFSKINENRRSTHGTANLLFFGGGTFCACFCCFRLLRCGVGIGVGFEFSQDVSLFIIFLDVFVPCH